MPSWNIGSKASHVVGLVSWSIVLLQLHSLTIAQLTETACCLLECCTGGLETNLVCYCGNLCRCMQVSDLPRTITGSLIDWMSDTLLQGYTILQSLVKCLDHRNPDTTRSQARLC